MRTTRRFVYWLLVVASVTLAVVYAERRDLYGRCLAHQEGVQTVDEAVRELDGLKREIEESKKRVGYLEDDPLEIEAAIRQRKDFVRDGETVYRIKEIPEEE